MGQRLIKKARLLVSEVENIIALDQPGLNSELCDEGVRVHGTYFLNEKSGAPHPNGPIAQYEVDMLLADSFPKQEPQVFEVGGRIPRINDRHVSENGECCVCVWEHWLLTTNEPSLTAYFYGPFHSFFLSQYIFEETGNWPFEDWAHGVAGLREAYAELLGIPNKLGDIIYRLRLLSQDWPKGHWLCPCQSGKILRYCHRAELMEQHQQLPPKLARRMLKRLANT